MMKQKTCVSLFCFHMFLIMSHVEVPENKGMAEKKVGKDGSRTLQIVPKPIILNSFGTVSEILSLNATVCSLQG